MEKIDVENLTQTPTVTLSSPVRDLVAEYEKKRDSVDYEKKNYRDENIDKNPDLCNYWMTKVNLIIGDVTKVQKVTKPNCLRTILSKINLTCKKFREAGKSF